MPQNKMQQIRVEKVTVNIGAGEVGDEVATAVNLLEKLTGGDAVKTEASGSARDFGLRPGLNIGAKVTLRGEEAEEFLERVLDAKDGTLPESVFDTQGNFSIGVEEYINMPGVKYDPDVGMRGFDVAVTLERPGYRVKDRKNAKQIGDDQRISPDEAQEFVQERFDVEIV